MKTVAVASALLLLLCVTHASFAQSLHPRVGYGTTLTTQDEAPQGKPPLNAWRISGELVTGVGVGLATGYVVGLVGLTGAKLGQLLERGFWGLTIGYTVGSAAGVYLIGTIGDQSGSFPKTLLGSTLGMGAVLVGQSFLGEYAALYLAMAPVGATLAFNLSRRYDSSVGVSMSIPLNKQRKMQVRLTTL